MVSFLCIIIFVGFLDTPFTCMTLEYKKSNTLANNFCTLRNNYCYYALVLHQSQSVAQWMSVFLMLGRSSLGDIARSHDISYHFYADDRQLYLSFETSLPEDLSTCKSGIEDCIKEIHLWMLENKLNFLCTFVFHIHFSSFRLFLLSNPLFVF